MSAEFPSEAVLIARGKYSTIASERRAILKDIRSNCESASSCAGRVLRAPEDPAFMAEQAAMLGGIASRILDGVAQLQVLQEHLNALKPHAWGGKAVEHEQ